MTAALTYDTLLSDMESYAERSDEAFLAQRPRLIALAENRLAQEVRGLGFQRYVTGTTSGNVIAKPNRWRETISINITTANGRGFLFPRSYDYCRVFWPDPAQVEEPRYYADYGAEHILLVPTPDASYAFELAYYERPEPLSEAVQTNWTTRYAPQLLLYAVLLETQPFLKRAEMVQTWQAMFDRALQALGNETQRQFSDRTQQRTSV